MTLRANYFALAAKGMEILMNQESYLRGQFSNSETLTIPVWELVKLRVSQINQCAFCIDMHSKDALSQGEASERILGLNAWRDMPFYSQIERAALEWAEHLTFGKPVSDDIYQEVIDELGEQAVVDLTIAVNAINSWNRIAKTFKPEVGSYKPQ
ncbi:MAG: carboxymuconolactone decarboxylase family protein [Pseudomonadales bacterium]|jgi:AhpD family alkylhydroperoxidase|uniref:carboxymuconolactone decarboxylase family protein n=1 Tax=Thalassolituus sp. UBA3500 TaxID=1947664 RepID=UPI000B70740D|nr:carboxymuconolactone decarboxylase family protein [Thalassolituus sp. UBA3500]MBN57490.1 alkylhydroperoxidase [Oceanospirillaceae bacterium]MDP7316167.1 carboxymuconolactone decarboxylase family protein [Pseudomonadales bacterium]OUX66683.1 MAG: alkylhydroperoxidase [Oceanospirillaceae bacterium TMED276]|tara:strand:- start:4475 stop:4936 length:462 start_codon:yes stop_codon:yes gene_type:complete